MTTDIEIDTPRGQSVTSSSNSSRTLSVHSNVFFTVYTEHVQALANNPTWADQVKISESEEPALSHVIPKGRED